MLGPDPGRGVVLSDTESIECTIAKHEELLKNDKQANRETKKTPLSISAFAEIYQKQALMQGGSLTERQATSMARDFCYSQEKATNKSAFHANRISFVVPELPWKRGKK